MSETQKPLPINTLITERMTTLGLSRTDLIQRAGYTNIAKGLRRLDELCDGDFGTSRGLLHILPSVLEISPDVVTKAVEATKRQFKDTEEAAYRSSFVPHAIILTERKVPQPIFIAAVLGGDRLLRVDFDLTKDPATFVEQALLGVGEKQRNGVCGQIPAFGKPTAIIVNYAPDRAVEFDLNGNQLRVLDRAYPLGAVSITIKGKSSDCLWRRLGTAPNRQNVDSPSH